jgi:hypothetical protein
VDDSGLDQCICGVFEVCDNCKNRRETMELGPGETIFTLRSRRCSNHSNGMSLSQISDIKGADDKENEMKKENMSG